MKVFLDANVLVSVVCNEYPRFTACSRVLSLADNPKYEVFTSPLCLGIAFYFAQKKNGLKLARKKLSILADKLSIADMNKIVVQQAANDRQAEDFEDAMQYYSALASGCMSIITYDTKDFWFSGLEVLEPAEFLLKHVVE